MGREAPSKNDVPAVRERTGASPRIMETASVHPGAEIGLDTLIGAFCVIAAGARIGAGTRIQSHTAVWAGVTLGEDVFVGPSATFTNVRYPRAGFVRAPHWDETIVEAGASIGANATLVAPLRIGTRAMIGAGAVVTRDVPPHAIVAGNPSRIIGWACTCGETLARGEPLPSDATCTRCRRTYEGRNGSLVQLTA